MEMKNVFEITFGVLAGLLIAGVLSRLIERI
jgi:hypothetical protein